MAADFVVVHHLLLLYIVLQNFVNHSNAGKCVHTSYCSSGHSAVLVSSYGHSHKFPVMRDGNRFNIFSPGERMGEVRALLAAVVNGPVLTIIFIFAASAFKTAARLCSASHD